MRCEGGGGGGERVDNKRDQMVERKDKNRKEAGNEEKIHLIGSRTRRIRRSTKEEQTATVLLDLTRLHYYYNIYLIETKGQQSGRLLPTHPSLQPKLAGRGSDTM